MGDKDDRRPVVTQATEGGEEELNLTAVEG